jgi:RNA polymerase primary sigma factor
MAYLETMSNGSEYDAEDAEYEAKVLRQQQYDGKKLELVPAVVPELDDDEAIRQLGFDDPDQIELDEIESNPEEVNEVEAQAALKEAADMATLGPAADSLQRYLYEISQTPLLRAWEEVDLAKKIEAGNEAQELAHSFRTELDGFSQQVLDKQQRPGAKRIFSGIGELDGYAQSSLALAYKIESGKRAKDKMVKSNLRLVVSIAKKWSNNGMPMLDLISLGNNGLIRAAEKFDWRKGFKFSTYATWWIRQSVARGLADEGRIIRTPVHIDEAMRKVGREKQKLTQKLGRAPSEEEIAASLDWPLKKVRESIHITYVSSSLDEPLNTDGDSDSAISYVPNDTHERDLDTVEQEYRRSLIAKAMKKLTQREREIIQARYLTDPPKTLEELGKIHRVTRERIRQIEGVALTTIEYQIRQQTNTFNGPVDL